MESSLANQHPMASRTRGILRALNGSSEHVEASAAMSRDGFIIGSVLGENVDADRFGAMCASLLALADRAADEVSRGRLKQVLIEGESGLMLLIQAGPDAVLAIAAKPMVNLGRLFIEARKNAEQIAQLLV